MNKEVNPRMPEPRVCPTCGAVTEWACPQDGTRLCRGGWERVEVDVYTNEARFTFACPHDGHPIDVIRAATGGVAYKVKSYAPSKMVTPAPAGVAPAIVIRTRKRRK